MSETCKDCRWAALIPQDFRQRTCRGGPPQLVVVPVSGPQGAGMQMQQVWPSVNVDHPICGQFKPRAVEAGILPIPRVPYISSEAK